jgi:poly-gamma-glutamate capsule biosynthesis protein CapA/YwtB (metallophosphatase superfamily)
MNDRAMTENCEALAGEVFHHAFEQVRYEIYRFPFYDVRSDIRYLSKYFLKKHSVNPSLARHFIQKNKRPFAGCYLPARGKAIDSLPALKISMTGDIMWMRKGWSDFISDEVLSFLQSRDIVLGNLETPVSPSHKVNEYLPDLFSYNSPPEMLDQLARCFTAVSLVNNHCLDQGINGLHNTIRELDSRKILHAGAGVANDGREYEVIGKNGFRVAFLAYAWGLNRGTRRPEPSGAVRLNIMNLCDPSATTDYSLVREHIRRARLERAQLVICSLHWGHEFELYPTYHMMKVARHLISLGVDVIMGHHPHVLQPFEVIDVNADRPIGFDNIRDENEPKARKGVVIYSLGNFVTAMYTRECLQSIIFNLDFRHGNDRLVLDSVSGMPIYCMKRYNGKFSPKVVALSEELKKRHPPHVKRVFKESCRDMAKLLGRPFVSCGELGAGGKILR